MINQLSNKKVWRKNIPSISEDFWRENWTKIAQRFPLKLSRQNIWK